MTARNEGRHDNPLRYLPGKTSPQIVGGLGKDSFNCDAGAAAWKILKNNHFYPTLRQENMQYGIYCVEDPGLFICQAAYAPGALLWPLRLPS